MSRGKERYRLLLVGKTGSGKSTTGNTIFGKELFPTDLTFGSVTSECQLKCSEEKGRLIEIMDSPGLYDTSKSQEDICTIIVQAVACMHPGPHAILHVVRLGRYTQEEYGAYCRLKALFDENITKYTIVVFTGGDELERKNKTFADLLTNAPKELLHVIHECRYTVFNNHASDPRPQVEFLLNTVRRMKRQNGKPYMCPKYKKIGEGLEEEVARRLEAVNKKDIEGQKYVQELEQKAKSAERELAKKKRELERKEQERKRKMEEEKRRRQWELDELREQMEQQQISAEQQRRKEMEYRQRMEEKQRQYLLQLERQRQQEREEMARREAERDRREEHRMRAEREREERRQGEYEREMRAMKSRIAEKKEPGFFARVGGFIKGLFGF